jgi:hypothetical protein
MLARTALAATALWLGLAACSALTAAIAFPAMKALAPTLPDFAAVGDHWKIAAGQIAQPVFRVTAWAQGVLAIFAAGCTALYLARSQPTRRFSLIIGALTAASASALAYFALVVSPRMTRTLSLFMDAARAASPDAAVHRAAFEADHPLASRTMSLMVISLLCTTLLWILHQPRVDHPLRDAHPR